MISERAPGTAGVWEEAERGATGFLGYEEHELAWGFASREMGSDWHSLDRAAKEAYVQRTMDDVVREVREASGDGWDALTGQEKRERFRARLAERVAAPVSREEFPDLGSWLLQNRDMLHGMVRKEAEQLYQAARTKWAKSRAS